MSKRKYLLKEHKFDKAANYRKCEQGERIAIAIKNLRNKFTSDSVINAKTTKFDNLYVLCYNTYVSNIETKYF